MIELESADSPSTSRVAPFGTFADPDPYTEVKDFSEGVTESGTTRGKDKSKHADDNELRQDFPIKPQTARDRDRMDAGKQALRELLKDRKLKNSKKTSCIALIRLNLTIIASLMIIGGLLVLLFLVPMTIDPALATINYEFDYNPAICLTLYSNEVRRGEQKNMWCSCTEGCTKDIYVCHQIFVAYRKHFLSLEKDLQAGFNITAFNSITGFNYIDNIEVMPETSGHCQNENWIHNASCWDSTNASLYVNVKGCGYPPDVTCDTFMESFNVTGRRFLCFYSKVDPKIVIIHYDRDQAWQEITYSLLYTCGSQIIGLFVVVVLHCPVIACCKSLCKKKEKVKKLKNKKRPKNWKDKVRPPVFQRDWYDVHT